ncbi:MAG: flavohemoglobin expression-modulating QEGLA motif protein [Flavobacteriales bacterium]|nr:flavohemoglobin expression-modulating QEGLA motif protein [Flavobacteriales bacterium]
MLKLTIPEIIRRIRNKECFEAVAVDQSFRIKIRDYVPYVCTAIHDGGNFRDELKLKTALSDYERWYEEDPHTADFISSLPIVLVGMDSRFEYDLNREPATAVYKDAWGKKVWSKPLTKSERERSLKKHANYYRVTEALVGKLEELFDGCVVYDMHSYNYKRWDREVPVFNIGTERINNEKFGAIAESWRQELDNIEIPDIPSEAHINDVFYGRGYNLQFITERFDKTLVLATEVSKIYCDELTGVSFPAVVKELRNCLKTAILNHAQQFADEFTNWKHSSPSRLLPRDLEKTILKIDKELYHLVKNFELLNFVNPTNIAAERKKFFEARCTINPEFTYQPIEIDPFELKRQLYRLPTEHISDVSLQKLYESVISAYVDKVDMLSTLGTSKFLYNSLRYFGEPTKKDLRDAEFLMHLPAIASEKKHQPKLGTDEARAMFQEALDDYGFKAKIEVSSKMVADAMVLNQRKKVMLKKGARFTQKGLRYLVHHEIGVHMVTTMNSNTQPLRIFNLGLPVNTKTQEGLAVLAEYLSGNITLKRLKELGLRVLAIRMMCDGADFRAIYRFLVNNHQMDVHEAFNLVTRVVRGGGFTKDYLYLEGFGEVYKFWKNGNDLTPLLIGKTSLEHYDTIVELIDRGILKKPQYITRVFEHPRPEENDPIFSYIVSGIG